jgi:CheY-like chemotaxis protein
MTPIGPPARVLVVDDDRPVLETLCDLVAELGHESVPAGGGREALELFAAQRCDLVITDLFMPEMNGLEFIRHLRELSPEVPVVLLTAAAPPELVAVLRAANVMCLRKPVELVELDAAIRHRMSGPGD